MGGNGRIGDGNARSETQPVAEADHMPGEVFLASEQMGASTDLEQKRFAGHDLDQGGPLPCGMVCQAIQIGGFADWVALTDIKLRDHRSSLGERHAGKQAERLGPGASGCDLHTLLLSADGNHRQMGIGRQEGAIAR
jgi:hypothetical protein